MRQIPMTLRSALVVLLLLLQFAAWSESRPLQPEETFDLSKVLPDPIASNASVSVEFVNNNLVALCWHLEAGSCRMFFLQWDGDGLHSLGSSIIATHQELFHRAGADHVFTTSFVWPTSALYSVSTLTREDLPFVSPNLASASGRLTASSGTESWTVYQLVPSVRLVRQGYGELLSVSDDMVAIRQGDSVRVETIGRSELGSFRVKPRTRCATEATLLKDALYLNTCGHGYIVRWNGKRLLKLNLPNGNPQQTRTNEAGTRLLFDYSTRHVSLLQSAAELGQTVVSLGVGAPDQFDNGEAVRVLEPNTGATCFAWQTQLSRTESFFGHAALSPSGQVVAIAHGARLSFYRLSEKCGAH